MYDRPAAAGSSRADHAGAADAGRGRASRVPRPRAAAMPSATVRQYPGGDHDLHAQRPPRWPPICSRWWAGREPAAGGDGLGRNRADDGQATPARSFERADVGARRYCSTRPTASSPTPTTSRRGRCAISTRASAARSTWSRGVRPPADPVGPRAALSGARGRPGWVFAGPGQPDLHAAPVAGDRDPDLLADKLSRDRRSILFASAAALTLGSHTVPVYEIYKAGIEPALGARPQPARGGAGLSGGAHPALRQCRGRQPRHPLTAIWARNGCGPVGGARCPTGPPDHRGRRAHTAVVVRPRRQNRDGRAGQRSC